jgi:hypothetical protein
MEQLQKGARVERLASPDKYAVPAGTRGVVMRVYETGTSATAYDVCWSLPDRELLLFSAGSHLRAIDEAAAASG